MGVRTPRELKMWDGAAEALLGGLKSHMPAAKGGCKTLCWPAMQSPPCSSSSTQLVSSSSLVEDSSHHALDITAVQTMLELNQQFLRMYSWPEEFKIVSDDAEDEGEEEGEEGEGEEEEQGEWLTENEFIGSRVCIMREEHGMS